MRNTSGGKGSAARPFSVSDDIFAANFDRIFGKKKEQQVKEKECSCTNGKCKKTPTQSESTKEATC